MANKNNSNSIVISKRIIRREKGVVVLPLKRWEKIEKENLELRLAIEAVLSGELALKEKKNRPFREFLKSDFPQYAKNL